MHIVAIALILLHLGIAGCIRLHSAQVTAALHSLNSPEYLQVKSVVTKQTESLSCQALTFLTACLSRLYKLSANLKNINEKETFTIFKTELFI